MSFALTAAQFRTDLFANVVVKAPHARPAAEKAVVVAAQPTTTAEEERGLTVNRRARAAAPANLLLWTI